MLAKVNSAAVVGVEAFPVEVEVDVAGGLPSFSTVGLPDNAVKESKDRVRSAVKNSGYAFPARRITVNLAPADMKKEGAAFDLPTALGLLMAQGLVSSNGGGEGDGEGEDRVKSRVVSDFIILGELSLDGAIKPIRGALSVAISARSTGRSLIVPRENAEEAALVDGVNVYAVGSLSELVGFLEGRVQIEPTVVDGASFLDATEVDGPDLSDVKGQENVKRALEVAAAGGHNVLMIGPPGSGKTMLARRLSTILPAMSLDEAVEATKVHSVAGTLEPGKVLVSERPFRAPHHTISDVGLAGGGQVPRPGEVSLAHNGVLFLDELPEFKKNALEVLRQPVEDGTVTISRAAITLTYPSSFMLVGAMNPCPCGYLGDIKRECECSPLQVQRYRSRLSGPLLDRIDIHLEVPSVNFKELSRDRSGDSSATVKERVDKARGTQAVRFKGTKVFSNSRMNSRQVRKYCPVDEPSSALLEAAVERLGLSARAYTRVLKLARTIADLEGVAEIKSHHVSEAIQYRALDRPAN